MKILRWLMLMPLLAWGQTYYNKTTWPPDKANTLYASNYGFVCDGVTDNGAAMTALNTATAALSGSVGSVYFSPQTAACLTSVALTLRSNLTVYAQPGTVTLKPTASSAANPLLMGSGGSNTLVYGLTFDGGGQDFAGSSPNANVVQVFGGTTPVSNAIFDHVKWQHTRGIALIFSTSVSNSGVRDSQFIDIGNHWKTSLSATDRKQAFATCCGNMTDSVGNFAEHNYFSDIGLDAMSIGVQTDPRIIGNTCEIANNQINIISTTAYAACVYFLTTSGGIIANNIISGASGNGIDTTSAVNFSIVGNSVSLSGSTGIGVFGNDANVTVAGNTTMDNNNWGAATFKGGISMSSNTTNVTISNNTSCDDRTPKIQAYGLHFAVANGNPVVADGLVVGSNNFNCNLTSAIGGVNTSISPGFAATPTIQTILAQFGIPLILPGGGTFTTTPSAAGGLTLTTALPNTSGVYPCSSTVGCYMYFPLGAICTTCNAGGNSAAGSYYTQCASTTSCSVFNNILGAPQIPAAVASPTSFGTVTTSGAYAQTVGSFVTLATIAIPANSMGANGQVTIEQRGSRASGANAIAQQFKFAGNIVGTNGTASVQSIGLKRTVQNLGATGRQGVTIAVTPYDISQINNGPTYLTVDTSVSQNIALQGELITSATDWLVLNGASIWVNYAP